MLLPELLTEASFSDIDINDAALDRGLLLLTWPAYGYFLRLDLRREGLPLDFSTTPQGNVKRKHGLLKLFFKRYSAPAEIIEEEEREEAAKAAAAQKKVRAL